MYTNTCMYTSMGEKDIPVQAGPRISCGLSWIYRRKENKYTKSRIL